MVKSEPKMTAKDRTETDLKPGVEGYRIREIYD